MTGVSETDEPKGAGSKRAAIGMAFGMAVLRDRRLRRNALFGLTFLTLLLVFGGTVFLGDGLMRNPMAFFLFWGICFLMTGLVLLLALYDLLAVRRRHRRRARDLERELAEAAEEARRLAAGKGVKSEKVPEGQAPVCPRTVPRLLETEGKQELAPGAPGMGDN